MLMMPQISDKIPKPRRIIDRKKLLGRLDEIASWSGYSPKNHGDILAIFKETYQAGWNEIRERFDSGAADSRQMVRANAFLVDQIITAIYQFALKYAYPMANPTKGEHMAIIAAGGYGRAELAPFSDVDLMFLLPYKRTPHSEQVVEFMLYMLWDIGLKVGHATRSLVETIRLSLADMTIRTSLLEARFLYGDEALYKEFEDRFAAEVIAGGGRAFVEEKLAERDARHEKMGDTRYLLEPNIKEGKGGLRDLQSLFWIAKYLYLVNNVGELVEKGVLTGDDARLFTRAEDFLWTVRCHLHYLAGRPEERITFNVQEDIGKRMGYADRPGARGVERFMKHYFLVAKDVGDLTRVICAVLEEQQKKRRFRLPRLPRLPFRKLAVPGFTVDGGRLGVSGADTFKERPVKLLSLFLEAHKNRLDIHPRALRLVSQNLNLINDKLRGDAEANRIFIAILASKDDPTPTLTWLNEAGVFGRFVPEFGRIVAQMQYDMYHVYTVDEHTIRAIGIFNRIERGEHKKDHPVVSSLIKELESRRVIYVAILLHDIAKGRGGEHSEIGAEIALKLCPRFGLSDWETETVAWLVRHHLAMSRTAFKRDLDDPKTVKDFTALVQSPERLRLLLALTVVDIRAVGPGVWNGWKAGLLRELYFRATEEMTGRPADDVRLNRVESAKAALREKLADWSREEIEKHLALGRDDYWLSFNEQTLLHHARLIRKADDQNLDLHIETRVDETRGATEFIIYTPDHAGLFAQIAGAMALSNVSVVDAKIITLATGMALDTFWVQDRSHDAPIADEAGLKRLWGRIEDALAGVLQPRREIEKQHRNAIPSRTRVFKVPPRVLVDNEASANHTVIEINGRDRPGLLHDLTAALTAENLQIASAHISTYGERVVDVFYIKDVFGLKVENPDRLAAVNAHLLDAIEAAQ